MISRGRFEAIKRKHGSYASWAVWAPVGDRPKSNVGDMSVLDPECNPSLLATLNPSVVMVGLNIARPFDEPLRNFHDNRPVGQDFKIRFAFAGTQFYGAYMTDLLKFLVEVDSSKVVSTVKRRPEILQQNADHLREELRDLDVGKPEIIVFGGEAQRLIGKILGRDEYSKLIPVTHYSMQVSKETYRMEILAKCERPS